MSSSPHGQLRIDSEIHILMARKRAREAATELGFGITDVTRIVTVASELSRNIFHYAKCGVMCWRTCTERGRQGLELSFTDHGPGIADVERALEAGFSTGKGMGMGLPGSQRLMDEMTIVSAPGEGTTVTVCKWLSP